MTIIVYTAIPTFMTCDTPNNLSIRLGEAFRKSAYNSRRRLCADSGVSHAYMGKILSGRLDGSSHGPGIFSIARIAENIGVSLDELHPICTKHGKRPGLAEFFARYRRSEPRLEDYADILDFCDIYRQPKRAKTKLETVGAGSLLAQVSGTQDASLMQSDFDIWPLKRRIEISRRHQRAWRLGIYAEPVFFEQKYETQGAEASFAMTWAGCRVSNGDGRDRLLIYCEPLREIR